MELKPISSHISQQFDAELQTIRTHLSEMGGEVQRQLSDALQAMSQSDLELAHAVVDGDAKVNTMELTIDEECTRILARRQPAASDLRLVIAITKAITDLERIGDEASKVARQVIEHNARLAGRGLGELRHIGNLVNSMLGDALDAFSRLDAQAAHQVIARDEEVDREYNTAIRELITYMMEDPSLISRTLSVIWALRALERIGDHSRNLAQYVVYLVSGEDIRHEKG
ncbi:MAG: phosphate signaling complex protein PhoU [Cellvibrio sp.]